MAYDLGLSPAEAAQVLAKQGRQIGSVDNPTLQLDSQETDEQSVSPEEKAEFAAFEEKTKEIEPLVNPDLFEGLINWANTTFKGTPLQGIANATAQGVRSVGIAAIKTEQAAVQLGKATAGAVEHALGMDAQQNIRTVMQASINVYGNDYIRARLSVAQAVLESGLMGKPSGLAKHNNLFGIKGQGTAGTVVMRTREVSRSGDSYYINAGFAQNATMEDSISQHAGLLNKSRYHGVMSATSFGEAAMAVQRAGYATDPNYAAKLIAVDRVISQYTNDIVARGPSHPTVQLASAQAKPTVRG